jgi:hypothetical protein
MIENSNTAQRSRRCDIITASGIAGLAALMLAMVMHHPVARHSEAGGIMASVARQASLDEWVHGTLMAAMTVMTSLMLGFATRLDLRRPHVLLGAVASMLALALVCVAMVLDGFVAPAIARSCLGAGGDCTREAMLPARYGGLQIEFMTRIGFVALAATTTLWAADLALRRNRDLLTGGIGLISAISQLILLLGNGERLNPHSLALIVAMQAAWYLSVALMIIRCQGPYRAAVGV